MATFKVGNYTAENPSGLLEYCTENNIPPGPWAGKANGIYILNGYHPSVAYLLLRWDAVRAISPTGTTLHNIDVFETGSRSIRTTGWLFRQATPILPSPKTHLVQRGDDPDHASNQAVYLCEFVDGRALLQLKASIQPILAGMRKNGLTSVDRTEAFPEWPAAFQEADYVGLKTWQELFAEAWTQLGGSSYGGLTTPNPPTGEYPPPQNIVLHGYLWRDVVRLLSYLGIEVTFDPYTENPSQRFQLHPYWETDGNSSEIFKMDLLAPGRLVSHESVVVNHAVMIPDAPLANNIALKAPMGEHDLLLERYYDKSLTTEEGLDNQVDYRQEVFPEAGAGFNGGDLLLPWSPILEHKPLLTEVDNELPEPVATGVKQTTAPLIYAAYYELRQKTMPLTRWSGLVKIKPSYHWRMIGYYDHGVGLYTEVGPTLPANLLVDNCPHLFPSSLLPRNVERPATPCMFVPEAAVVVVSKSGGVQMLHRMPLTEDEAQPGEGAEEPADLSGKNLPGVHHLAFKPTTTCLGLAVLVPNVYPPTWMVVPFDEGMKLVYLKATETGMEVTGFVLDEGAGEDCMLLGDKLAWQLEAGRTYVGYLVRTEDTPDANPPKKRGVYQVVAGERKPTQFVDDAECRDGSIAFDFSHMFLDQPIQSE